MFKALARGVAAVVAVICLVGGAAVAQEGGLTLTPAPDGTIGCSGSHTEGGTTYTCADVQSLAEGYAASSANLPADLPQAVMDAAIQIGQALRAGGGQ